MRVQRIRGLAIAVFATIVVAGAACDDNGSPAAPSPTPGVPPGPPPVSVVRLEVIAPESIALGSTAQVAARLVRSDGSTEDATGRATWSSENAHLIEMSSSGVASARNRGEARVTARLDGRSAFADILSLPSGTFRLTGHITEEGVPLGGVTVTVIAGTGDGLTASTTSSGQFRLYGVAGSIRLHSKKPGYLNLIRETQVGGHSTVDMELAAETARPDGGMYTLVLAATGCSSSIPAEALRRTYDARLERQGPRLTVRLSGAPFIVTNGRGDGFEGLLQPNGRVEFNLGGLGSFYYYYYYYAPRHEDVVERLNASSTLVITGSVIASLDAGNIMGTMSGSFSISARTSSPFWPYTAQCTSGRHRFEMRKR